MFEAKFLTPSSAESPHLLAFLLPFQCKFQLNFKNSECIDIPSFCQHCGNREIRMTVFLIANHVVLITEKTKLLNFYGLNF